jgi:hypothetical protein
MGQINVETAWQVLKSTSRGAFRFLPIRQPFRGQDLEIAHSILLWAAVDAMKSKRPFRAPISAAKLFEQVDLPNGRPKPVQFLTCSFHFEFLVVETVESHR